MANRIITLSKSTTTSKYVFKDIAMKSNAISVEYKDDVEDDEAILRYELSATTIVQIEDSPNTGIKLILGQPQHDLIQKYNKSLKPYQIAVLINQNAVINSIHNIFSCIPGERILNPEFGSNLRKYLYEGITDENIEKINAEIHQCISKWEPRAKIEQIENIKDINDIEDNTVHLKIIYSIPDLEKYTGSTLYLYNYSITN